MRKLIEVRNLTYTYPNGTTALSGVDFDLYDGETVVVLGANGSGKSTFALHLNGLIPTDSHITICGEPLNSANLKHIRSRLGLVFQNADEQLFMPTVLDDVLFGPLNAGCTPDVARRKALRALESTGYTAPLDRSPQRLSAGEKRRVAIAGVLAMDPEVLVLDEPTTSLDPPARRDLATLLATLPQAKVIITHDTVFARKLSTRAVFFHHGKLIGAGTVDELIARFNWED